MNADRAAKTKECRCQQPKGRANNIYGDCKVLRGAKSPPPTQALPECGIGRSFLTNNRLCSSYDLTTYQPEPTHNNRTLEPKHKQHDRRVQVDTKDDKNRYEHPHPNTTRNNSITNPPTMKAEKHYHSVPTHNKETPETKHKQHDRHVLLDIQDDKNHSERQPPLTPRNDSTSTKPPAKRTEKTQRTSKLGQTPPTTQKTIDTEPSEPRPPSGLPTTPH